MSKYYLTTPIYYVNDQPHIGHLYTTFAADILARYHKLRGKDVFLLTGTDENSQKNVEAAAKKGYTDIQAYLDMMSGTWKQTFTDLGIGFDDFIRTTDERHKKGVEKFWHAVQKDDIYLGEYEGLYCTGCEGYKTESELVDGLCPLHKKAPEKLKEKNYFFKLTVYREKLLAHIDANPDFIQPESRRNEVRSYVDKFMADISISRETVKWGIPVPTDPSHVIYVWFDALINYLTGIGYGTDEEKFNKYWPADLHLVGKDIIKFHCALWPAMLMSAGMELPKSVFAHGFFTINGEKMSKSLGNAVNPVDVTERYGAGDKKRGADILRFFLLREITFGEDGDFSEARLADRYANDLGNEFGNLLHRVLSMTEKYFDGKVPAQAVAEERASAAPSVAKVWADYEKGMESYDFANALDAIWSLMRASNKLIDDEKPWVLAKSDTARLANVMYVLLERLRHIAWMLKPIMPEISKQLLQQLGIEAIEQAKTCEQARAWGGLLEGGTIHKDQPLFPRLVS